MKENLPPILNYLSTKMQHPIKFSISFTTEIVIDNIVNHIDQSCFFIIDDYFHSKFIDSIDKKKIFWLKSSEKIKTLATAEKLLDRLSQTNLSRSDTIIAIGGGITLDLSAFCASLYKRGCRLWLVPTTLIGMIDACIGGKTGVNIRGLKNQIGSFYPASRVILDFDFLNTLSEYELKNGYAELIKMMIIDHRDFFEQDFTAIEQNIHKYIQLAIQSKLNICANDLTDTGIRQTLNLGHTFAHLFETITDYDISHGAAVASGLFMALKYSLHRGIFSQVNYDKISHYINHFCNHFHFSTSHKKKIKQYGKNILLSDKKANKKIKLILVNDTTVETVYVDDANSVIEFIIDNL